MSSAVRSPNERFRRERKRRGWSREYVAEQIGIADTKTIGRWERGVAFPRAYYLQKLCALFEMFAVDLGFYEEEREKDPEDRDGTAGYMHEGSDEAPPSRERLPIYDPTIPSLAVTMELPEVRGELLHQIKQGFCVGEQPISSALYGVQGVGKTTLAIDLVHDHEIQRFFHDGILWVELGHRPNVLELLRRWGILLGFTPGEAVSLMSVNDLGRVLHEAIGARHMLLVIDDARRSEDAYAFKLGGPYCAYILTTRVASVALDFASDRAMLMRELNQDAGPVYMEQIPPVLTADENGATRTLVRSGDGFSPFFRLS